MILVFTNPKDKEFISLTEKAISLANLESIKTKIISLKASDFIDVNFYSKEIKEAEACIIDIDQMKPLSYAYEFGSIGDMLLYQIRNKKEFDFNRLNSKLMLITRNNLDTSELMNYFKDFYSSISIKNGVNSKIVNGLAKWIKETIESSKPKVFISYRSSKVKYTRKIVELLVNKGALVWFDEFKILPGDSIPEAINRGISWCTHMILIIDQNFFKSKWTQAEMESSLYRYLSGGVIFRGAPIQRPLIPLFLVDPKNEMMPPLLQRIKGIDCRKKPVSEIIELLWNSIM